MKRPNILLMVSDDHGREAVGCYGNPVIDTPNMDALAADGTRYTNAFCTASSCAPSRASILTGLHGHTNGAYGLTHAFNHFSCFDNLVTLPRLLGEAGYRTGRAGKKHYAPDAIFPFDFNLPENHLDRDDVKMAEDCRELIAGEDPFFLYWASFNPHRINRVVEEHPCRPNTFGNPSEAYPDDEERVYTDDEVIVPSFLSDTPEARAELAQYYQSVSRLDRGIGRLFEILKETGKYNDTLIIYISDNGAAFPVSKTTLYEPSMQLPCIIKTPHQRDAGKICEELVSWVDIMPTLLDAAGVETDQTLHGISILDQAALAQREEIYATHSFHGITNYYPMRLIRTKTHKFIWNIAYPLTYSSASDLWNSAVWQAVMREQPEKLGVRSVDTYLHRPKFELYDLEKDPDELTNLAELPKYAEQVAEFCGKLKAFQQDTNDPWLHKWEYE